MSEKEKRIDPETGKPIETDDPKDTGGKVGELKYTQEAFNKAMANKDKEVSSKFEKQIAELKAQFEAEKVELKNTYLSKGEERAKMSAEERAKDELKDQQEALKAEREALQNQKNQVAQARALTDTENALKAKGIPTKFANLLTNIDPDIRQQNIDNFASTWTGEIETAVDKKVTGSGVNPQNGSSTTGSITAEKFKQMSITEQSQLYMDNPDLYNKLKKESYK